MNDRTGSRTPSDDSDAVYEREASGGVPRWVKLSGIVALLVALLVVIMMLVGGGEHGPSRHGSAELGGQAPPSIVAAVHDPSLVRTPVEA